MATGVASVAEQRTATARRRPWRWRLALLAVVLVLGWLVIAPPPPPAGGRWLTGFSPATLASLEQEAWEAYYYRQWPRLFWLLLQVMRSQFGLSWAQAIYAAYLNTQAQLVFARQGDSGGEAQALMARFYALVKEPLGAQYDPERAAAAELRWWVVHRHRQDYPDAAELVHAMTALYSEVYGLPPAAVEAAARGRVKAVEVSDRWLAENKPAGSPLLAQVRQELLAGYTALSAAVRQP